MQAEDKHAITELLNRAAFGLDMRELEMLADCFAEDAVMTMRIADGDLIGPFEGQTGIMQLMKDALAQQTDQRRHVVSNVFFSAESSDTTASVTSYLSLITIENGQINLISTGVYQDEVSKTSSGWKLLKRHLDLDLPY